LDFYCKFIFYVTLLKSSLSLSWFKRALCSWFLFYTSTVRFVFIGVVSHLVGVYLLKRVSDVVLSNSLAH